MNFNSDSIFFSLCIVAAIAGNAEQAPDVRFSVKQKRCRDYK